MEIATQVMAVLGFALSMFNFINERIKNIKRLKVVVDDVFRFGDGKEISEILNMKIINKSHAPITVIQMVVSCDNSGDGFGRYRKRLMDINIRTKDVIKESRRWDSDVFPINIAGLGYASGLFVSDGAKSVLKPDERCRVTLFTNRGVVKKSFSFTGLAPSKRLSVCRAPSWQG